jgi:hypothetical protein
MTLKESVNSDPWPWLFRGLTAALLFFVGISAFLAEQTLSDIRTAAKDTLAQLVTVSRQVDENSYHIRQIDRDCCAGRNTDP